MRTIDIRTTQNVTITYELALVRDRIFAFLIDVIALLVAIGILVFIFEMLGGWSRDLETAFYFLVILPLFLFYTLVFEFLANGRTLGKMALQLKVVKLDGTQLQFGDYMLRWVFRMIDIWGTFGALAGIVASSTDHGQRLGGLVSNSTVVRLKPKLYVRLSDILKINSLDNYEPQFPAVRNFRESDMLLMKQTLERYYRFKNDAHKKAVVELSVKASEVLGLPEVPERKIAFVKTLIKDYIVLTR